MATLEEVKATLVENAAAAADVDVRLDGINVKIDELRALVAAGNNVTPEQLDELRALADQTKASLGNISTDLADAEQS